MNDLHHDQKNVAYKVQAWLKTNTFTNTTGKKARLYIEGWNINTLDALLICKEAMGEGFKMIWLISLTGQKHYVIESS